MIIYKINHTQQSYLAWTANMQHYQPQFSCCTQCSIMLGTGEASKAQVFQKTNWKKIK